MRITTITRQALRRAAPVARTHDTPPSPTRIAQAKAERHLLDLVAACNVPGVDIVAIANSIASRSAVMDDLGTRDIGAELSAISAVLSKISEPFERLAFAIEMKKCEIYDAAAGASSGGGIPQHPTDCATLPPVVIEQIERSVKRDAIRSGFAARAVRGASNFGEVDERVERMMREHDKEQLPLVRIGNAQYAIDTHA